VVEVEQHEVGLVALEVPPASTRADPSVAMMNDSAVETQSAGDRAADARDEGRGAHRLECSMALIQLENQGVFPKS
jgi:hypothetical protein